MDDDDLLLLNEIERIVAEAKRNAPGALDRLRGKLAAVAGVSLFSALLSRVRTIWRTSVDRAFTTGQTLRRDEPWLQWQLGRTEKHCRDCLTLNGQIHRASEWRAAGIQPQSPDLECGGWNCDCRLVEVAGYEGQGEGVIV